MISSEFIENQNELNSFLKLEKRTSLIYKELLSRGIISSSAYKLPDSLRKIYDKSISIFNYEQIEPDVVVNGNNQDGIGTNIIHSSTIINRTPSPLKKKQHVIDVLSICRQNFTGKLSFYSKSKDHSSSIINEELVEIETIENCKEENQNEVRKICKKLNFDEIKTDPFRLTEQEIDNKDKSNIFTQFNRSTYMTHSILNVNNFKCQPTCNNESGSQRRLIDLSMTCNDKKDNNMKSSKLKSVHKFIPREDGKLNYDEIFCRICKEDNQEKGNKLISICDCEGLIKYSHSKCMVEFLRNFEIFQNEKKICEICNIEYRYLKNRTTKCKMFIHSFYFQTCLFFLCFIPLIMVFAFFFIKSVTDWKYSFYNILLIYSSFIMMIGVIYIFVDIFTCVIYEDWIFYDGENQQYKKNIVIPNKSKSYLNKNNQVINKNIENFRRRCYSLTNFKKSNLLENDIYIYTDHNLNREPSDINITQWEIEQENPTNSDRSVVINKLPSLEINFDNFSNKRLQTMPSNCNISENVTINTDSKSVSKKHLETLYVVDYVEPSFFMNNEKNRKKIVFKSNIYKNPK